MSKYWTDKEDFKDYINAKDFNDAFDCIEKDVEAKVDRGTSETISAGAVALGDNSVAGAKAFKIMAYNEASKSYTLNSVEGLAVGDSFSLKLHSNYLNVGEITAISGNVVSVDNFKANEEDSFNLFRVANKPTCGTVDFGTGAIALGGDSYAVAKNAVAIGEKLQSRADSSFTEGCENVNDAVTGHVEGFNNAAKGWVDHVEGANNVSTGGACHNEGVNNVTSGWVSHAEGDSTKATATVAHSEGAKTEANAYASHSEGEGTIANGEVQHVQGKFNVVDLNNAYADVVGNGKSDTKRSNAYTLDWNGNAVYAGNVSGKVDGADVSLRSITYKFNDYQLSATNAGRKGTNGGEVFNDYTNNVAKGGGTHAEGIETKADGYGDHAEGVRAKATGGPSHAEGLETRASGYASHAECDKTIASGPASHAEGLETESVGWCSHAEGRGTKATSDIQHAEGKFNILDSAGKYLHIAGNGKSDEERSNAYTLDWQGNANFAGDVSGVVDGQKVSLSSLLAGGSVPSGDFVEKEEGKGLIDENVSKWFKYEENEPGQPGFRRLTISPYLDGAGSGLYDDIYIEAAKTSVEMGHNLTFKHEQGIKFTVDHSSQSGSNYTLDFAPLGTLTLCQNDPMWADYTDIKLDRGNGEVHALSQKVTAQEGKGLVDENLDKCIKNVAYSESTETGAVELNGTIEATAVILKSPNGNRWKLKVNDDGSLSTEAAS